MITVLKLLDSRPCAQGKVYRIYLHRYSLNVKDRCIFQCSYPWNGAVRDIFGRESSGRMLEVCIRGVEGPQLCQMIGVQQRRENSIENMVKGFECLLRDSTFKRWTPLTQYGVRTAVGMMDDD